VGREHESPLRPLASIGDARETTAQDGYLLRQEVGCAVSSGDVDTHLAYRIRTRPLGECAVRSPDQETHPCRSSFPSLRTARMS
jgi:hypothetical protein